MTGTDDTTPRSLGLWTCTALVVGNMIGSGIFLLPASLGAFGGISLLGWLVTTAGAMLLAVTFAELARRFPHPGGPYAYTRIGFGDLPAFLVAWGYWVSICAGNAAIAVATVGYLAFFWAPLATSPYLAAGTAITLVWLLTWVNARGVHAAGRLQLATTILKLAPLVAIGSFGLLFLRTENFAPFNASDLPTGSAVLATATLTLWAFLGLESATVPAASVTDASRTIPRATLIGTGAAAVVYILSTVGVMGVLPPGTLAGSTAPFADAATAMWGGWAGGLVAAGAVVACFGALNGWILLQGQMPLAAAMDGMLPPVFARVSPTGAPTGSLLISSALVTMIVGTNYMKGLVAAFTFIILLSTLTVLLPYVLSSLALVITSVRSNAGGRGRGVMLVLAGAGATVYSLWMVVGAGTRVVLWGTVLLLAGVPAFYAMRRRVA
jgi:APA family basic amino acid/polyamine antiporter